MKCPVCRAAYRPGANSPLCRRCGVDLAPLIQLADQALWHYRQAIAAFCAGNYPEAMRQNHQALALQNHQADFHALAGQLWALQGDLGQAIAAWQQALRLNPQHPTAHTALACLNPQELNPQELNPQELNPQELNPWGEALDPE